MGFGKSAKAIMESIEMETMKPDGLGMEPSSDPGSNYRLKEELTLIVFPFCSRN